LEFIEYAIARVVCWFFKFRILAKQWDLHSPRFAKRIYKTHLCLKNQNEIYQPFSEVKALPTIYL